MSLSPRLLRLKSALTAIDERTPLAVRQYPAVLVSEANSRDKWAGVKRTKAHRSAAYLAMRSTIVSEAWEAFGPATVKLEAAIVILLVRMAPRMLDDDNCQRAFKAVRDGIADALGIDDRDERIVWVYDQEKAKTAQVRIEVYRG